MTEIISISIVVMTVLVAAVVVCLYLRWQKKAVMDEVSRLLQRLTEMEKKIESLKPTATFKGEESMGSSVAFGRDAKTSDLSAMSDEELFGYLSKSIKDEEMFRWRDLNRNALMEHFSLSAARIGNAFVRGGGMNLPEFVRNCRLDYACRLMVENPEMSFTKVGYQSGYQRTTTFNHDFKARFGMSPAEYREQELRNE